MFTAKTCINSGVNKNLGGRSLSTNNGTAHRELTLTMAQQLTFVPWLINEVEQCHHPGLYWENVEMKIMRIPWPRATEETPLEELGVIFCWHKFKNGETHIQNRSPSNIKGNFRAILNTRDELKKLKGTEHKDPNPSIKIQLLEDVQYTTSQSTTWSDDIRVRLDSHDSHDSGVGSPLSHIQDPFNAFHSSPIHQQPISPLIYKLNLQNEQQQQQHEQQHQQHQHQLTTSEQQCWPEIEHNGYQEEWLPSSYPDFAHRYLDEEIRHTGTQCQVWLNFKTRGKTLCERQVRIDGAGLLIYSDMFETDFDDASPELQEKYGTGSLQAEKLFLPQLITPDGAEDVELQDVLENFGRGLILKSDNCYNLLAQRNCKVKAYFGHGNQAAVRHMVRPSRDQRDVFHQIYNYSCFIEMASQYKERMRQGIPCNSSDQPTYLTLISLGQEWNAFNPISSLPFYIEIYHDRGAKFHFEHLQEKVPGKELNNIIVSLSNSVDRAERSWESAMGNTMDLDSLI